MSTHYVSIDEQVDPDYAARAFCACGWAGDVWHHADEAPAWWTGVLAAFDAAEADGAAHLADEADEAAMSEDETADFYGACGVRGCRRCLPRYDLDNVELPDDPAVDPPDPARFRALRVPPVGQGGFAEPEAAL